jgi:hypothetical protein
MYYIFAPITLPRFGTFRSESSWLPANMSSFTFNSFLVAHIVALDPKNLMRHGDYGQQSQAMLRNRFKRLFRNRLESNIGIFVQ